MLLEWPELCSMWCFLASCWFVSSGISSKASLIEKRYTVKVMYTF